MTSMHTSSKRDRERYYNAQSTPRPQVEEVQRLMVRILGHELNAQAIQRLTAERVQQLITKSQEQILKGSSLADRVTPERGMQIAYDHGLRVHGAPCTRHERTVGT